jgi:hypothetical protein
MWLALSLAANPAMGSLVFKDHTRACQLSGKDPSEKYDPPGTIELYNIYRRKL